MIDFSGLTGEDCDTEEGFEQYRQFFDEFEEAGLDRRLQMARDKIVGDECMDAMWTEELLEALCKPLLLAGRGREVCDLVDLLREERPHSWSYDAGDMADTARMTATLAFDLDGLDVVLRQAFERVLDSFTANYRDSDIVMYHGRGGVLAEVMAEVWPTMRDEHPDLYSFKHEYAYRGFLASVGSARDHDDALDWERVRELPAARLFLEAMDDEDEDRRFVEVFCGEVEPTVSEADFSGDIQAQQPALNDLCTRFARDLVEEHGWPACRALMAVDELRSYLNWAEIEKKRGQTGMSKAGKSLRRYLAKTPVFAPDPFALAEYVLEEKHMWPQNRPHAMGALAMAAVPWAQWLAARGLLDKDAARSIGAQIRRRLDGLSDKLLEESADRVLAEQVAACTTGP